MAGTISISSITLDSDNNFSIKSNTGATILSANGTGLITGIADSSITSSKLTSNISIANLTSTQSTTFMGPIFVKANVVTTGGLTANVTVSTLESGVLVFTANSAANSTINFTGLSTMPVGNVASYVVMVPNGSSAKYISTIQIDGVGITPKWAGGVPTSGTSANTDLYSFNIVKTSATPSYNVFAQVSNYF